MEIKKLEKMIEEREKMKKQAESTFLQLCGQITLLEDMIKEEKQEKK